MSSPTPMFTECPSAPPGPAPSHPVLPNPPLPLRIRVCWRPEWRWDIQGCSVILQDSVCLASFSVSPLPVNPKGNQSWIFIGRTDAEAKAPILWPPDSKSWLIGKDPDADGLRRRAVTEDEMVGWHHQLNEHESEQTSGHSEGQGSLACCISWCHKEVDTTERLNWNWTE